MLYDLYDWSVGICIYNDDMIFCKALLQTL